MSGIRLVAAIDERRREGFQFTMWVPERKRGLWTASVSLRGSTPEVVEAAGADACLDAIERAVDVPEPGEAINRTYGVSA